MSSIVLNNNSGYILIGDPCYVIGNDSSGLEDAKVALESIESSDKPFLTDGFGAIIRVPQDAQIKAFTSPDQSGYRVAQLTIRLDGTDEFITHDGGSLIGDVSVDAGLMAAHDPYNTILPQRWSSWAGFLEYFWRVDKEAVEQCIPTDPSQEGAIAISSTGYGDGSYPVALHRDWDGKLFGITISFIDCDEDDEFEGNEGDIWEDEEDLS